MKSTQILTAAESGNFAPPGPVRIWSSPHRVTSSIVVACVVLKLLLEGHGRGSFGAAEPCRCVWVAVSARCPPRWSHRCYMVLKLLSMVLYERDALLALSLEVLVALSKVCACCAGWRVVGAFVRRLAQCRVQGPHAFISLVIILILSASSAYSSSFHLQLRRRQHWQMLRPLDEVAMSSTSLAVDRCGVRRIQVAA